MKILTKKFGIYEVNSYIVIINNKSLIIDPGENSLQWLKENAINPIAILNTHGHSDHIWGDKKAKDYFRIKIYLPIDDRDLFKNQLLEEKLSVIKPDVLVYHNEELILENIKIKFHYFPGHTIGNSCIEIENILFSGDFLFKNTIGRSDFAESSSYLMKKSIEKMLTWDRDIKVYPGHGRETTTVKNEKQTLKLWKNILKG